MNIDKIRVALPLGDYQPTAYQQLIGILDDAELLEMCSLTVFGPSKQVLGELRGQIDPHIRVNAITQQNHFDEKLLNVIDTTQTAPTPLQVLAKTFSYIDQRLLHVVVSTSVNDNDIASGAAHYIQKAYQEAKRTDSNGTFVIYQTAQVRLISLTQSDPTSTALIQLDKDTLTQQLDNVYHTLQRDYLIGNPRIAVLRLEGIDNTPLADAITAQVEQQRAVYGTYSNDIIGQPELLSHFDAIVSITPQQILPALHNPKSTLNEDPVAVLAGANIVLTAPAFGPTKLADESVDVHPQALRNAIYVATSILRNRMAYDTAHRNPLPKLYHERREDGDRPRFANKKSAETTENNDNTDAETTQE